MLTVLHDATLVSITFDWASGSCVADFAGSPFGPKGPFRIRWRNVTHLNIPRVQGWGPSVSVLSASEPSPGNFEMQLQSGDLITLRAGGVVLEPGRSEA
jgi:hypothetical protein